MPSVTITLADTPKGSIAIKTDFLPAAGRPCSPAQGAALDIQRQLRKDYGITDLPIVEIDIDAVHKTALNQLQSQAENESGQSHAK